MLRVLTLTAAIAIAFPVFATDPPKPEFETVSGVVKEIHVIKNGITFRKTVVGAYGPQEITDYRRLGEKCVIVVDGIRMKLSDVKPGYQVKIEYEKKTEYAVRVTATSPEVAASERRRKEAIAETERKAAEDELRALIKAGAEMVAKQKAAAEKAQKDRTAKMKGQPLPDSDKNKDAPKDGEKKDEEKKDPEKKDGM